MNRIQMTRVINRIRYNTETATLIASDVYWDGHNMERGGRNTWLYRTNSGRYFTVHGTFWQGERDTLQPVTMDEAVELYETNLTEHEVEYEEAFPKILVEDASAGRPPIYDEPMIQTGIWLPQHMITWLKSQPGTMSDTMRSLIQQEMDK